MTVDLAVIGGGLAGCAAAIELARAGRKVALVEQNAYPSHKLCGEFLSPEAQRYFQLLGVADVIEEAGPSRAHFARVTTEGGACFQAALPGEALGLSRFVLDRLLFETASSAGAHCFEHTTVTNVNGDHLRGFELETTGPAVNAAFVLGAFGKRSSLERDVRPRTLHRQSDLVAFKQHFEGNGIGNLIELHAFRGGYCGLMQIESGRTNACWISTSGVLQEAGGKPDDMIQYTFEANPRLAERFSTLSPVPDTLVAIGQISLRRKSLFEGDVMMIGDAAAMIAPLCGDGMSMALRSAQIAVPLACRYLDGGISFDRVQKEYRAAWRREFGRRLLLGRVIHQVYSRTPTANAGVTLLSAFPAIGRWLIRQTRGPAGF